MFFLRLDGIGRFMPSKQKWDRSTLRGGASGPWTLAISIIAGLSFGCKSSRFLHTNKRELQSQTPQGGDTQTASSTGTDIAKGGTTPPSPWSEESLLKAVEELGIAPSRAETHRPTQTVSPEETAIEKKFFNLFWTGAYEQLDSMKSEIQGFLARKPESILLKSRLAYANLWQWQERFRTEVSSNAPEYVSECVRLFNELFPVDEKNMVFRGFGTNCVMLAATLNQSDAQKNKAYELAFSAIRGLREYAPFALSYTFLVAPRESVRFKAGLAMLFSVLDVCYGQSIDRERPVTYDKIVPANFKNSAYHYYCENTFMAPHNAEGFLFTLADALLKAGKIEPARIMYENVKKSSGYATFPYQNLVDQRLSNLEKNSADLARPFQALERPDHLVVSSAGPYACTICHRASAEDIALIMPRIDDHIKSKGTLSGALLK